MNLSSAGREYRAGVEAMHLAVVRGATLFEMCGLDTPGNADTAGASGIDQAKVRLAGELMSRAARVSDVRFELVAALRARIEAGTYRVSAEDVAASLMGTMRR